MSLDQRIYGFELTGSMPLLMHHDDVERADDLIAWRKDPKNKSVSVAGDDRSPAWTWQTYLYHDGDHLAIPQGNLMTCLRYAGTKIASKGKSTFKSLSQSGLLLTSDFCEFLSNGKPVAIKDVLRFRDEPFSVHKQRVRDMGFDLLVNRAKVGVSKHVRVRAKFSSWSVSGSIQVLDAAITTDVLDQMFAIAGTYAGLCDWRPSSKESPGPYGTFTAKVSAISKARKTA
jgi:hypothetical protein